MPGTITLANGLRNMNAETYRRAAWKGPEDLARLLEEADESFAPEGWWSPHAFRGPRNGDAWVQSGCLAVDVDGPGKHDGRPLTDDERADLEGLFARGELGGSVFHVTHSGFRIVLSLMSPTRSGDSWKAAHRGAQVLVGQAVRGLLPPGWVVDRAVANLANLNWLPNTTDEKGRKRQASVFFRTHEYDLAALVAVQPEVLEAPAPKGAAAQPQPVGSPRDCSKAFECLTDLGPEQASDYDTWLEVGMVLHAVFGGNADGLTLWHLWSRQAESYDPQALEKRWPGFRARGRGLGSLVFLARKVGRPGAWEAAPGRPATLPRQTVAPVEVPPAPEVAAPPASPPEPAAPPPTEPPPIPPGGSDGDLPPWDRILELTDYGAGLRLAWALQGKAIYLGEARGWAWWTGRFWEQGEPAAMYVQSFVLAHMRRLTQVALEKIGAAPGIVSQALRQAGTVSRCRNAISVVQSHPEIYVDSSRLDVNPYLLSVANGTLDLTTLTLRPHSPADLITSCSPIAWDPAADMERWTRFLDDVAIGDQSLIGILRRAAGWTLTGEGSTKIQKFVFLYGRSNSGKGVFVRSLAHALGRSLCSTVPFSMIGGEQAGGPNSSLAQAEGKRMVIVADTGGSPRWDGEVLKSFTGGDWISCSEKNKPQKTYLPKASLWLCANDKPLLTGHGKSAVFNRMILIPFRSEFSQDPDKIARGLARQMDPTLEETLFRDHASGILRWCVEGAREYLDLHNLGTSKVVQDALAEYQEHAQSPLEEFANAYIKTEFDTYEEGMLALELPSWADYKIAAHDLHALYSDWCEQQGYKRGDIGTTLRTARAFNAIIDNVSRFRDVRKNQIERSVLTTKRSKAWARLAWTKEAMEAFATLKNKSHREYHDRRDW